MKNKTKLVLGLSILTAAALTAGATGTFAWFTTNRKATAIFNNITAKSVEGSLTITMGTLTEGTEKDADGDIDKSINATLKGTSSGTTDVSSQDGVSFAHPNWTSTAGNENEGGVKGIKDVSDLNNYGKNGYWTAYYIGLKNGGGSNVDVYLTTDSKVTAASNEAKDTNAASWTRVAINVAGNSKPATLVAKDTKVIQPETAGKNYVAVAESATKYTPAPVSTKILGTLGDVIAATDLSTVADQKLVTITAGTIQYLTVSVWLEGTAAVDQDLAIGGSVNVQLIFAGVTAA
jgi:hypothetical protein